MTRQRFAAFIVGLSVVGASTQALAHHGNASSPGRIRTR